MKTIKEIQTGAIGNYYGGLYITKHNDKYYWLIENYNTDFQDIKEWSEISEKLFNELKKESI